jgi:hypothetical protein
MTTISRILRADDVASLHDELADTIAGYVGDDAKLSRKQWLGSVNGLGQRRLISALPVRFSGAEAG